MLSLYTHLKSCVHLHIYNNVFYHISMWMMLLSPPSNTLRLYLMYGILKTQLNNMMRNVSTTATTIETTMTTTNTRKYLQTNTTNTHFYNKREDKFYVTLRTSYFVAAPHYERQ